MLKAFWLNRVHLSSRVSSFFLGEYFTDALRNTLVILFPIVLLFTKGYPEAAIGIGVGTILISLTDLPGNRAGKFRTAVVSNAIFFLTALIISLSLGNPVFMAAALCILTFLLSMLSIFGTRSALTGTMAIILSTFTLGLNPADPLLFSCYIFLGGVWYYLVSLIQIRLWPYKYLHHAIFECLLSTSRFLKAKTKCYDESISLAECYQQTISLHIKVNEKQDLIRNLLLSDKYAMHPSNVKGQRLLTVAKRTIALYEQATAVHYDYDIIRTTLAPSGSLVLIRRLIELLAEELKILSGDFLRQGKNDSQLSTDTKFKELSEKLAKLGNTGDEAVSEIIRKILINIKDIKTQIEDIKAARSFGQQTFEAGETEDYNAFLSTVSFGPGFLKRQFSFKSTAFRFSLRLSLSFLLGYLLILLFPSDKYSYWLLLTIVIVARPRFAITWKRNKERLVGTLAGAAIGFVSLLTVQQAFWLLVLASIFLLGFFIFNRIRYTVSVMCITPAVIICLSLYHGHTDHIISERIYYTAAGCFIAFAGLYLFPVWESNQSKVLINEVLQANINFLEEVIRLQRNVGEDIRSLSLARKNAHLALARFSEAVQIINLEPGAKNNGHNSLEAIQVLNYRINAVITSLYLSKQQIFQDETNAELGDQLLVELKQMLSADSLGKSLALKDSSNQDAAPVIISGVGTPQLQLLTLLSKELRTFFVQTN